MFLRLRTPDTPLLLLPQHRIQLRIPRHCDALRLAAVGCDLHERDAPPAVAVSDDFVLAFLVVVDVDVVVLDAGAVEVPQGADRVAAPVCAIDDDSFSHECPPADSYCELPAGDEWSVVRGQWSVDDAEASSGLLTTDH